MIKKLDLYVLKKFLLIFAGAFFICLFVFMMQFTWRYVDELIGKGLSVDILAQFFWYMGITLVPQSLPLAILLAALITFGNLGESLELLAMKAAGIPLLRIMLGPALVALTMLGVSFYFQNFTSPAAQIQLHTLLFSMKQQSPAVEIPEGVFYSGVPNVNIYVEKKDAETGMLYQAIIYKTDQGFDRAQIVLADSARMEMSADKMHLILDLWKGEQFENLQSNGAMRQMQSEADDPYDRETFDYKRFLIDFDSNFNLMDKEMLAGMAQAKNMMQIERTTDSLSQKLDSIGAAYYQERMALPALQTQKEKKDSQLVVQQAAKAAQSGRVPLSLNFDSLKASLNEGEFLQAQSLVQQNLQSTKTDLEWKAQYAKDAMRYIRAHWVEWHQKMTLALACLIFFFVGAPLGAIIRKGGLGMPTVISVIIFIFWYIINTSGMKMARDGNINMVAGMWVSTTIITPFGLWICYKSNKDSVVFNVDTYRRFFQRLLGIPVKRHLTRKEVIIHEPQLEGMTERITNLADRMTTYARENNLWRLPSYVRTFFRFQPDHTVKEISKEMESIIEELSNSRDVKVLGVLNEFPVFFTTAHLSPFKTQKTNRLAGIFFPLGLILWLRMGQFRLRLLKDLRIAKRSCERLVAVLNQTTDLSGESGTDEENKKQNVLWRKRKRIVKVVLLVFILALLGQVIFSSIERYRERNRTEQSEQQEQTEQTAQPKSVRTMPDIKPVSAEPAAPTLPAAERE